MSDRHATGTEPLIRFEDVKRHFPVQGGLIGGSSALVRAVDGVSFELRAGETLALVGESGCGKSTLGRLLVNVDRPTAGTISYRGRDLATFGGREARALRRRVQMIFQDPFSSLNPRMTVGETIAEPLLLHGLADRRSVRAKVAEIMAAVGLAGDRAGSFPHQFSGGQRQRIGIARALAVEPEVIVCDEPVSALDVSIRAQILNLLQDLQRRRRLALLFISHDLGVVRHVADRVAVMYLGRIVETAEKRVLFERPRHPYTRALLAAIPEPSPQARRDRPRLEGELPSPVDVPSGCRFHPRCRFADDHCRSVDPALVPDGAGIGPHAAIACHRWPIVEASETAAAVTHGAPAAVFQRRLQLYRRALEARATEKPGAS
jgi:oligopeptide/dipeptide ABC transporter ATP-binding protein